jgi:hypothetical protein
MISKNILIIDDRTGLQDDSIKDSLMKDYFLWISLSIA